MRRNDEVLMMDVCPTHWPRMIALIDMNALFASVEPRDFPSLLGQPVAITNGLETGRTPEDCMNAGAQNTYFSNATLY